MIEQNWQIIAEKNYPDAYTYSGPAQRFSIIFRGPRTISLKPDWLLNTVVWGESKTADIIPLRAVIREKRESVEYVSYIISQYEIELHYHESPMIASVYELIVSALIGSGFMILSKTSPVNESWVNLPLEKTQEAKTKTNMLKYLALGVAGIGVAKTIF